MIHRDETPSLDVLHEAITAGLPDEQERWDCALENEDFYQLRNEQYIERRPSEEDVDFQARPKRTSHMTRTVVRKLAAPLYKPGPTRRLTTSAAVDAWLQEVYRQVHVNAKMQSANRAAILNHVAALQVEATGDSGRPIRLMLWKGHEFAVFCDDGEIDRPWAVVTRDTIPAGLGRIRARYRAWSATETRTYLSEPYAKNEAASGKRTVLVESDANPLGILPFVLVRNAPVESEFWEGGIGTALKTCNMEIDRELSDIAEHAKEFLNPKFFLKNVATSWRGVERVGAAMHLKPAPGTRDGDNSIEPDAFYRQADLGVEAAWFNLKNYADMTIEELEVPLTAVRSDAATDLSGIAIVAKTLPLLDYTRDRQPQFTEYEEDLARVILAVGGRAYEGGDDLAAAGDGDPGFECVWPEPQLPLPTPERDQQDAAELEAGLTDPIEVIARRRGLTLQQAEAAAKAIAGRLKRWNAIMKGTEPPQEPAGTPSGTGEPVKEAPNDPEDDDGQDANQD